MKLVRQILITSTAVAILGIAACGGGGSSSNTASKYIRGPITAFGSVYVNSTRYDTSEAKVYVEDGLASESDLKVGMNVTVKTSSAGKAEAIYFDDNVEGIVIGDAIDNGDGTVSMNVMGYDVMVDSKTIFESQVGGITSAVQIVDGNIVEVSGSFTDKSSILASRLEVKSTDLTSYLKSHPKGIEMKGNVAKHNEVDQTFEIGSMLVNYATAKLEMPAGSWNDLYVEVKSTAGIVAGQLLASKVELEDGGHMGMHGDKDDEMEVKGEITEYDGTSMTVNGQVFLLANTTKYEHGTVDDLAVGVKVEVEGTFDADGQLLARKVEFAAHEMDHEVVGKVEAIVATATNTGTITIAGVDYAVTAATIMHDSTAMMGKFNLSQLKVGDGVEIHYVADVSGNKVIKLERKTLATP